MERTREEVRESRTCLERGGVRGGEGATGRGPVWPEHHAGRGSQLVTLSPHWSSAKRSVSEGKSKSLRKKDTPDPW